MGSETGCFKNGTSMSSRDKQISSYIKITKKYKLNLMKWEQKVKYKNTGILLPVANSESTTKSV